MAELDEIVETDNAPIKERRPSRRLSRYEKSQARRAAQRAADSRFYGVIFALMGLVVMVALLIAAMSVNGARVDVTGLEGWTKPWLGPLTKLEAAGLVIVGIIAIFMYHRIRKK